MLQNSAMINLKTKFEGSSIRPCAKHSVEQAVDMEIPTETCTHDLKKNVNLQHYFFRFRVFF